MLFLNTLGRLQGCGTCLYIAHFLKGHVEAFKKYDVCALVVNLLECTHVGAFDAVLTASYFCFFSYFGMKTQ